MGDTRWSATVNYLFYPCSRSVSFLLIAVSHADAFARSSSRPFCLPIHRTLLPVTRRNTYPRQTAVKRSSLPDSSTQRTPSPSSRPGRCPSSHRNSTFSLRWQRFSQDATARSRNETRSTRSQKARSVTWSSTPDSYPTTNKDITC
jgi:hypothetical protein